MVEIQTPEVTVDVGRRDGSRPSSTAETTKVAASTANAARLPLRPTSSPPSAGPAATCTFSAVATSEFAWVSCDGSTSCGTQVALAGLNAVASRASTATSAASTGKDGNVAAMTAITSACPTAQARISERLSQRSANAPPSGPSKRGSAAAINTIATAFAPYRAVSRIRAVLPTPSPRKETIRAAHNARNSRCRSNPGMNTKPALLSEEPSATISAETEIKEPTPWP